MAAGLVINRGSAFNVSDQITAFLSGGTIAKNDLVNLESGELLVAGTGDFLAGIALEAATSSSVDVQVNTTPWLRVVMDNDNTGTTFAVTHVGARFDITGTTGAQIVDTSSVDTSATAPTGTLVCDAFNPQGIDPSLDSDTSVGLFTIKEHQLH